MTGNVDHATSIIEAFNKADWDAMPSLLGDSSYNELGTQRTLQGSEIIEAMKGWKGAMPDVAGSVTSLGLTGAAMQMFTHGTITGLMFLLVGFMYEKAHTRYIPDLGGRHSPSI